MLERVADGLPRAWAVLSGVVPASTRVAASFTVLREPNGYVIRDGDGIQTLVADGGVAAGMLRTMLRRAVGASLRNLTCVEAGVVRHQGRGIMLPARALGGTTTLVRALVAAGAELHSDEFALIDGDGMLVTDLEVGSEAAASRAVPLGLVALTVYRPGSEWTPKCITPAEGVVALMACVPAAHEHAADTLATLRLALQAAAVLQGDRGEADGIAAGLLEAVATKSPIKSP
jgi:hypothetical protein